MKRYEALETPDGWVVALIAVDTDADPTLVTEKGAREWATRLNARADADRGAVEEAERLREALMAAAPLAEVPGTPDVVAAKLRGIVHSALRVPEETTD